MDIVVMEVVLCPRLQSSLVVSVKAELFQPAWASEEVGHWEHTAEKKV